MKSKYNPFVPSIAMVISLIAINTAQLASADTGTWSGPATGGTWDTTDLNWTGVTGTPWDGAGGPSNTATFNTASLDVTVADPVFTNGITFSTSGTLSGSTINLAGTTPGISVAIGQTGTISSTVAGSAGLIKSDAGVLTLSSASYTGGTTVNGGRLVLQNTFTGGRDYITNAELEVNITSDQTITFGNPGGTISGTGNLIKTGSGTLRLTDFQGMQAIALTGASSIIDIQAGTITQFDARTPLLNNLAGMNIASGANFDIGNSSAFVDELTGAGSILKSQGGGSTLTVGVNNGSGTFTGTINTGMGFVKQGSGTQTLTNSNTYAGSTTISGGTLQVGGAGRLGNNATYGATISIASGATLQFSTSVAQNFSNAITGLGGITKDTNTNDLTLSSTGNTYSGTTTVSAGRIIATAASHLSNGATSIVQSGVGQMFLQNAVTYSNPFNISGTGYVEGGDIQNNRSGAIRLGGGGTLSGTITLSGNSRIATFGNVSNTISGQITGGFGIEFYGFQNTNSHAPAFVLTNTANNYTGNTTIINSGYNNSFNQPGVSTTLRLGASNVIPDGASAGNVAFAINGANNNAIVALDLNGFNETINGLTVNPGTFATRIQNTAASGNSIITIGANDTTSSFSGTILDLGAGRTLAVTKIGSGILTLSGNNNYSGATTVSAGTLALVGGSQTSAITVAGSASLGFTLGSPTTSTAAVTLTAGTVAITGTVDNTSDYQLMTAASFTGPFNLASAIPGYQLETRSSGTQLWLARVSDPYLAWSGGAGFDVDSNNDGVANGLAWLLGASGPNVSALDKLPVVAELPGGGLQLTFNMLPSSARSGASLALQHSSDLGISDPWASVIVPDTTGGSAPVTFVVSGTDPLTVVGTVASSEAAGGKLFGRLRANR